MAYVPRAMRDKLAADAAYERQSAAIKKVKEWVVVPFEWQLKQTKLAVQFSTYGWVPQSAIAGQKADGTIVPWSQFREGDKFLLAKWIVEKNSIKIP